MLSFARPTEVFTAINKSPLDSLFSVDLQAELDLCERDKRPSNPIT